MHCIHSPFDVKTRIFLTLVRTPNMRSHIKIGILLAALSTISAGIVNYMKHFLMARSWKKFIIGRKVAQIYLMSLSFLNNKFEFKKFRKKSSFFNFLQTLAFNLFVENNSVEESVKYDVAVAYHDYYRSLVRWAGVIINDRHVLSADHYNGSE